MHRPPCGRDFGPAIARTLVTCALLLLTSITRGDTEVWNPGGAGQGDGTWDTVSAANWNSGQVWVNGDDAIFSGTGGAISLGNPSANSLTFTASGPYMLEGGMLTLTGSEVSVHSDATISSPITSTVGLLKTGLATLTLTGSDDFQNAYVDAEAGNLEIENTAAVTDGNAYVGEEAGSAAAATVSGTGSLWATGSQLTIGGQGTGALTVADGGSVLMPNGEAILGSEAGSSGMATVTGPGSSWSINNGYLFVGISGSATMSLSNGGSVTDYSGFIDFSSGSAGLVTVSDPGSSWVNNNDLYINTTGALVVAGGGAVSAANTAWVGNNANSNSTLTVSDPGSLFTSNALVVGASGTGNVFIGNGGAISDASGNIGDYHNSAGMVTVSGSGSTWTNTAGLAVGVNGRGTLLITNGGSVSDANGTIGGEPGSSGIATVTGSGSSWVNTAGLAIGGTDASAGTGLLLIANGGSVTSPQTMVFNGGTLGGNGVLDGPVAVEAGGILAPGATLTGTAGIVLTIGSNVALDDGSTLDIDIDATTNASDLLDITNGGNLTLSGDDTLTVDLVNGAELTAPDYVIATLSGGGIISGTFAQVDIPSGYTVDYGVAVPGQLQIVAVPEPATWGMLLGGIVLICCIRRPCRPRWADATQESGAPRG